MKKAYIPIILFLLVVLEGVALDFLPEQILAGDTFIISHWVFVFLVFIAIYFDEPHTYYSVLYAVIFGLLVDIVYTDLLGVYMFSYAIVTYLIHQCTKLFHPNFYTTILFVLIGVSLTDLSIYMLYSFIGKINLLWGSYAFYRLLPTVLANIIFFIGFYPIIKKRLISWSGKDRRDPLFNR